MKLLDEGYQPHEVGSMVKADRGSVRHRQGPWALQARLVQGRPSKLTDSEKARLENLLLRVL